MYGIIYIITFIFLLCCSVSDIRTRTVSAWLIFGATAAVLLVRFYTVCMVNPNSMLYFSVQSIAVYAVLKLFFIIFKNKIGVADYDVLFIIYLSIGITGMIVNLICSCMLAFIRSLPIIFKEHKKLKTYSVPFIPYLGIGYLIVLLITKGRVFI